jgi:hypothetical protein
MMALEMRICVMREVTPYPHPLRHAEKSSAWALSGNAMDPARRLARLRAKQNKNRGNTP